MPLYMDIHEIHGATPEDVAKAHAADVEVSSQSCERIEQHDDVSAELHLPLAALDHQLGQVEVLFRRLERH